jgi:NAD(P)-dependent dehydrogenase (short-subunit alcohol dehydrogenase family)
MKNNLLSGNASIVNIASTRAFQSQPDTESYSAAKGGIVALTHAMAVSLAGRARVNCISPGWIETSDNPEHSEQDKRQQPVGRVGSVSDIAEMVLYLCGDKAGFITGENITIDGGMSKLMIYHNDHGWKLS